MTGKLIAMAMRPAKRAPMVEVDAADIRPTAGLAGDFGRKAGRRQVTVLAAESWSAVCADLGVELPWTMRRANLLVEGLALAHSTGQILRIGGVVLEVTGETDPCVRMDAQHFGLMQALEQDWRGGVTCRVLSGGRIEVGQEVDLVPAAP